MWALPFEPVWLAYTLVSIRVSSTVLLLYAIQSLLYAIVSLHVLDAQQLRFLLSIYMLTFVFISSIILFYALLYAWVVSMLSLHVWEKP